MRVTNRKDENDLNEVLESIDCKNSIANSNATFLWGFWCCQDEITFLLDETDVNKFPEECLIVSPQRWRVVKLCGRPVDFDETGIVSSMSRIDSDIPTLNISTATTNCTLVPEEMLSQSLEMISSTLKCLVEEL